LHFWAGRVYPKIMNVESLVARVKHNCNVSDARFWGYYSLCGMLIRMRSLYRAERGMMPWEPINRDEIGRWISEREHLWESLENDDYISLEIDKAECDPFDPFDINEKLDDYGLVYGSGYGIFSKPTFFLARPYRVTNAENHRIIITGDELCRDLSSSPAMQQGGVIIIRRLPLFSFIWERLTELRGRRFPGLLHQVFSLYRIDSEGGPSGRLTEAIEKLADDITGILILHELGEAEWADDAWLEILASAEERELEFQLRAMKDMLADTARSGPLRKIINSRDLKGMYLYMFLLDPYRRKLFPEIQQAFQVLIENSSWDCFEDVFAAIFERVRYLYDEILLAWRDRGEMNLVKKILSDAEAL